MPAIIATFITVIAVCSRPAERTFRQLIDVNSAMKPIAAAFSASSPANVYPVTGANTPRNVAVPTAYAAIDPGVTIQNRFQA